MKQVVLALVVFAALSAHGAIKGLAPTLVQSCGHSTTDCVGSNFPSPSATAIFGLTKAVTSGNLIVMCPTWSSISITLSTVTDNFSNTWTLDASFSQSGLGHEVTGQCAHTITGSSGTINVTVTLSGSAAGGVFGELMEFTNISGTLDTSCTGVAAAANSSVSTSCTTTTNGDLLVNFAASCCGNLNAYFSGTPQFAGSNSARQDYASWSVAGVAGLQTATYNPNAILGSFKAMGMVTLAFKPAAIAITTTQLADGAQTDAYHDFISCVGGTAAYTFSAVSGLPAWASVNSATGEITGTPNANGTSTVQFRCTDGTVTANKTISLKVGSSFKTPTFVQSATTTTGSATLLQPVSAGDLIIVTKVLTQRISALLFVNPISEISDSMGNVYVRINPIVADSGKGDAPVSNGVSFITYAAIASVCASGLTVNNGAGSAAIQFLVEDWSGAQQVIDDATYAIVAGTGPATYNQTTPNYNAVAPNETLHAIVAAGLITDTLSISSPFTTLLPTFSVNNQVEAVGYRPVTATGNYTVSTSLSGGGNNSDSLATFLYGLRPALAPTACVSGGTPEKYRRRVW